MENLFYFIFDGVLNKLKKKLEYLLKSIGKSKIDHFTVIMYIIIYNLQSAENFSRRLFITFSVKNSILNNPTSVLLPLIQNK